MIIALALSATTLQGKLTLLRQLLTKKCFMQYMRRHASDMHPCTLKNTCLSLQQRSGDLLQHFVHLFTFAAITNIDFVVMKTNDVQLQNKMH